ncbi:hypothetical protein BBJ28_00020090, partial [Nothophytophthora sp. Chile5]
MAARRELRHEVEAFLARLNGRSVAERQRLSTEHREFLAGERDTDADFGEDAPGAVTTTDAAPPIGGVELAGPSPYHPTGKTKAYYEGLNRRNAEIAVKEAKEVAGPKKKRIQQRKQTTTRRTAKKKRKTTPHESSTASDEDDDDADDEGEGESSVRGGQTSPLAPEVRGLVLQTGQDVNIVADPEMLNADDHVAMNSDMDGSGSDSEDWYVKRDEEEMEEPSPERNGDAVLNEEEEADEEASDEEGLDGEAILA